jgi:hypothetical protein
MDALQSYIDRTETKLRYGRIHLDELYTYKHRGSADDFESAHQEAYLYHLLGALDSFLQELNVCYDCNLQIDRVTRRNLHAQLNKAGYTSPELDEITSLENDPNSWLAQAKEMRDHSTHRNRIPRVFYKGGDLSGQVRLRQPKSGKESNQDWVIQFQSWHDNMTTLLNRLRVTARERFKNAASVRSTPPAKTTSNVG